MCDPISISAGVAAAQAGYTAVQQNQRADALNGYQEVLHDANTRAAKRAALSEFQALDRRQNEERARAAQAVAQIARQTRLATGAVRAEAETTSGASVAALIGEFERQSAEQRESVSFNLESVEAQLQQERVAVREREAGRIASTVPNPIPGADYLGLAIGLTSDILGLKFKFDQAALSGTQAGAAGVSGKP